MRDDNIGQGCALRRCERIFLSRRSGRHLVNSLRAVPREEASPSRDSVSSFSTTRMVHALFIARGRRFNNVETVETFANNCSRTRMLRDEEIEKYRPLNRAFPFRKFSYTPHAHTLISGRCRGSSYCNNRRAVATRYHFSSALGISYRGLFRNAGDRATILSIVSSFHPFHPHLQSRAASLSIRTGLAARYMSD